MPTSTHLRVHVRPSKHEQVAQFFEQHGAERAKLSADVSALLRSIDVAIMRLMSLQAKGASSRLSGLEQNFRILQDRAVLILGALSNPENHFCLSELLAEEKLLKYELYREIFDEDKGAVADAAASQKLAPDALSKAINAHPLIGRIDAGIAALTTLHNMNATLGTHITNVDQGVEDLGKAITLAVVVADTGKTTGVDEDMHKAEVVVEHEAAEAKAAHDKGDEEEEAYHKRMAAALWERALRIHDAAIDIGMGMHEHYNTGRERILNYYQQFVEEPLGRLREEYPAYYEQAKVHLGKHADGWREQMDKIVARLSEHVKGIREAVTTVSVLGSESTGEVLTRHSSLLSQGYHHIRAAHEQANATLDEHKGVIRHHIGRLKSARANLVSTLEGAAYLTGATEEVLKELGVEPKDTHRQIGEFHAMHAIRALKPLGSLLESIQEKWKPIYEGWKAVHSDNKDEDHNAPPHPH